MSTQNVLTFGWNGTNPQRTEVNASGHQKVNIENSSIPITSSGTLNVSDSTAQTSLSSIDGKVTACDTGSVTIVGNTSGVGDATATKQDAQTALLTTLAGAVSGTEIQCDIVSSTSLNVVATNNTDPATATKQDAQTAQLSTISSDTTSLDGKISQGSDTTLTNAQQVLCYGRDNGGTLDALRTDAQGHLEVVVDDFTKGQALMASSFPVVVASDQSTINTDPVATRTSSTLFSAQSIADGANATSSVLDMDGTKELQIIGNTTNTGGFDNFFYQYSTDNVTYYTSSDEFIAIDSTSGDFSHRVSGLCARYVRFFKANTSGSAETITLIACTRRN